MIPNPFLDIAHW